MRKTLLALSLATVFGTPAIVSAQTAAPSATTPPSDHTIAGNVGLFSDYV